MSSPESPVELWITPVKGKSPLKHTSIHAYGKVLSYGDDGFSTKFAVIICC